MSGLSGTAQARQLFEVLRLAMATQGSGCLNLTLSEQTSHVYVSSDRIQHARFADLQNDEAILELLCQQDLCFVFEANEVTPVEPQASQDLQALTMSSLVAISEAEKYNFDLSQVPRVRQGPPGQMDAHTQRFWTAIDQRKTLRALAKELAWSSVRIQIVAGRLLACGAITLEQAGQRFVDVKIIETVRRSSVAALGPAGDVLFQDVAARLGLSLEAIPVARFADFMRAMAEAINDPQSQARFIEAIRIMRSRLKP